MKSYVPINTILNYIPKQLRRQAEESDLLEYALQAYNLLDIKDRYEQKAKIIEIVKNKAKLPSDLQEINLVTYLYRTPATSETDSLTNCISSEDTSILDPSCFCNTAYYNKCFTPMKYVGNSNTLCSKCGDARLKKCTETYQVDWNRNIITSIDNGFICVFYSRPIKDNSGNYLVLDIEEVLMYLAYYTSFMEVMNRMLVHEENSTSWYDKFMDLSDAYYLKAKGAIRLRGIDPELINAIKFTGTPNQKMVQLPASYFERSPL